MTNKQQTNYVSLIRSLPTGLQDALGLVAINEDGFVRLSLLKKLEARGLVMSYRDEVYGNGTSPIDRIPMCVIRWRVPILVHIAWAAWCSQTVDELGGPSGDELR